MLLLLAASGSSPIAQSITNDPRQIFFAESPARLILIDGDPVYRRVAGTELERIVNTSALIVRDSAGIHYLKVLDGWMESYALTGDWSASGAAPSGGREALERAANAQIVDVLEHSPTIFISSEPAALIVTDGPARYETVEGTSLEYLANTTATVFREPTDQELYVLVAGRWFRSWTTDGPWEFIPSNELPADIRQRVRPQPAGNVNPIAC
jgi:hypothetical protein